MKLTKICNKIIKCSFYLLFFLVPLILTPWNYELFEFNKMLLVYFLTSIVTGAWLVKMIARGEIRIQRTPLDIPILIFLISEVLSFFFSIDHHVSFWGYYSRFHGGLLSTICYIILYYAFATNLTSTTPQIPLTSYKKKSAGKPHLRRECLKIFVDRIRDRAAEFMTNKEFHRGRVADHKNFLRPATAAKPRLTSAVFPSHLHRLLTLMLTSAALVSIYGILEHFGIDKNLWVQDVQNRVFSTLGQPNWLAAYLCIVLPITIALALNSKHEARFSQETPLLRGNSKQSSKLKTIPTKSRILDKIGTTQMSKLRKMSERFKDLKCRLTPLSRLLFSLCSKIDICHLRFEIFTLLSLLFYLCLLFTKSRSGFLAFWISDAILIFSIFIIINKSIISLQDKKNVRRLHHAIAGSNIKLNQLFQPQKILKNLLILNLFFLLITFFIGSPLGIINRYFNFSSLTAKITQKETLPPPPPPGGPALETGVTESGTIRKIVWKGAIDIARHFPLFGSGVETFAFSYYRFKPKEHNLTSEWDFLYNKAHNEYLNYAATTGLFGLGSYLFLIAGFIWWNIKKLKVKSSSFDRLRMTLSEVEGSKFKVAVQNSKFLHDFGLWTLDFGLLAGWLSILITNFFGFSVVIVALFFWLIPAISFLSSGALDSNHTFDIKLPTIKPFSYLAIALILLFTFYFLLFTLNLWYADASFAKGNSLLEAQSQSTAQLYLEKAVLLNSNEPLYQNKFSLNLANLAMTAFLENEASLSATLFTQALSHSETAITISPQNVDLWKGRTRLFYTLSQIDEQYLKSAIESLLIAQKLAPTDAKIAYNLALLYGGQGETEKAIDTLKETIDLKPNYRDAHFALALFYKEKGLEKEAIEELKFILEKIDPQDEEIKEQLGQFFSH